MAVVNTYIAGGAIHKLTYDDVIQELAITFRDKQGLHTVLYLDIPNPLYQLVLGGASGCTMYRSFLKGKRVSLPANHMVASEEMS